MSIIQNRSLKAFICLLMVLIIIFQFSLQPKAEFVLTTSIAIKVLAMILGSMGLLTYIQQNGGMDLFYEAFIDWTESVKQIQGVVNTLYMLAYNSIRHGVKMTVSEVSAWVKEFFTTEVAPPTVINPEFPLNPLEFPFELTQSIYIPSVSVKYGPSYPTPVVTGIPSGYYEVTDTSMDEYFIYGSQKLSNYISYFYDGKQIDIGGDYSISFKSILKSNTLKSHIVGSTFDSVSSFSFYGAFYLYYKGSFVNMYSLRNYGVVQESVSNGMNMYRGDDYTLKREMVVPHNIYYRIATDGVNSYLGVVVDDMSKLTLETRRTIIDPYTLNPLPQIGSVPEFPDVGDVPVPLTVPSALPFPWQLENDKPVGEYVGGTVEDILQDAGKVPIDTWVEGINVYPKTQIDSLPQPNVKVDSEGIITEVSEPSLPVPDVTTPEIVKGVGILGSILAFLQSLFTIPDNVSLDFSPLQNLGITDKFPFSLPWDLMNTVSVLMHPTPKPPRWEVPIVTETLIIDFAQFESLALIARSFLSLIFIVSLVMATRRFIGGA